jgi:hypothetical protein
MGRAGAVRCATLRRRGILPVRCHAAEAGSEHTDAHTAHCGPLAQLAEQQTLNLRVEGSIPSRLTI